MRDLSSLRNRLLAAMGFVAAAGAAACESPKPVAAATPADATAADAPAQTDAAVPVDGAADAAADTAGNAETSVTPDAVADAVVPVDAAADVAPDAVVPPDAVAETAAPDAVAETVGPDAVADVPDAGPPVPDQCKGGGIPATYTCFGAAQLKNMIENEPQGGKPFVPPDAGSSTKTYEGPLPPEGCPDPSLVKDGCCMPAVQPGDLVGDTCCYWHCAKACCGRPLEVDGQARVAGLVARADWLAAEAQVPSDADELAPAHVVALADAWRADAADEHASVASFQRFGLDLLALGAPPDLVADAARAVGDEVAHARLCFGIAARVDGQAVGPGRLDVTGIVARGDLASAAVAAVREGCVGETLAAAQAAAAARGTTDPTIAVALAKLADDEARHAELAWRFVAWACAEDAAVRDAVAATFDAALRQGAAACPREAGLAGVPDAVRRRWGRLGAGAADRLARAVLTDVVGPCATRLLGGAVGARHGASAEDGAENSGTTGGAVG